MTTNKALEKIKKMITDYKTEHLHTDSIVIPLWEFEKFPRLAEQAIQEDRERIIKLVMNFDKDIMADRRFWIAGDIVKIVNGEKVE